MQNYTKFIEKEPYVVLLVAVDLVVLMRDHESLERVELVRQLE